MRPALTRLAPAALLLLLACQPKTAKPIFGPWEEGLTLSFENPTVPQPQRSQNRMQVRVAQSTLSPGMPSVVRVDIANTRGQVSLTFRHQDGGIALIDDKGQVLVQPLPIGFPDVAQWVDRGTQYRMVGRGAWEAASVLPAGTDMVGYWVESRTPEGFRRRLLFLPNLGEVEAREERGGEWVTVNRLVARGFTDVPSIKRS